MQRIAESYLSSARISTIFGLRSGVAALSATTWHVPRDRFPVAMISAIIPCGKCACQKGWQGPGTSRRTGIAISPDLDFGLKHGSEASPPRPANDCNIVRRGRRVNVLRIDASDYRANNDGIRTVRLGIGSSTDIATRCRVQSGSEVNLQVRRSFGPMICCER